MKHKENGIVEIIIILHYHFHYDLPILEQVSCKCLPFVFSSRLEVKIS